MGKVVTREWRKANVLNWNLHSFQLLEIIQVLDSISWVRCASGNVCLFVFDLYLVGLGGKIRDALSALCLSTDTSVNASTAHGLCWIEQHTRLPFNPTQNCSLSANPLSISKNGGEKLPMPTTNLYDKIQILYFTTCVLM